MDREWNVKALNQALADNEARRISTNTDYSVVMANDMVKGHSNLSLNELKLLRTIIMQIKKTDVELYPYKLSVQEFADIIGSSSSRIYADIQKICLHLCGEVILIGDGNPKHKWKIFQWLQRCSYDNGVVTIQLHDDLKPYVMGLQNFYTQFQLEDIVHLNSTYALRILELIYEALKNEPVYADKTAEVYLPLDVIRRATGTEHKYKGTGMFKDRVITEAIKEINAKNEKYFFTVRDHKLSRKIVGFYVMVESKNTHEMNVIENAKQMCITDYPEFMPD